MATLEIPDIEVLLAILVQYGVPLELYGTGAAKTLNHLLEEVQEGECELVVEQGRVIRSTRVICLDLYKGTQRLVEYQQRFKKDRRVRKRTLDASAGEKLKRGELPYTAAKRLLEEEFPFACEFPIIFSRVVVTLPVESQSYPGIPTQYEKHFCDVHVPETEIPDLVVVEPDKEVFYRWVIE